MSEIYNNCRILEVDGDNITFSTGYHIYDIVNGQKSLTGIVRDPLYSVFSNFKLSRRFLRAEIHRLLTLYNGNRICIAKKGLFLQEKGQKYFKKTFDVSRGSRPMNICEASDGILYFGEYYLNPARKEVRVYSSSDYGKTWQVIYTFMPGTIRHIHGIYEDPYTGCLWITTGDEDDECILAFTTDRFKTLNIAAKGDQRYRACTLLFLKDKIIYGTDSPYRINSIYALDRVSFALEELTRVQGSVINSCQIGENCFISTTVEPSKINPDKHSHIWHIANSGKCREIACYRKDIYNSNIFQFGNIRFPLYRNGNATYLYFSGHALRGIDGKSVRITLNEIL